MRGTAAYLVAATNTALFAGFVAMMFVTDGWIGPQKAHAAGGSLMLLIFWTMVNAAAAWRLCWLERD